MGWPPSGWVVSDRGLLDDAGPGARLLSEGWEPLEVEDSGVLIRVDRTVAGPGGVLLIGEPYGSGAPIGWVLSDDGGFELVGQLPFHPDYTESCTSRGWPMVLPVADGFVAIGRRDPGLVEVSSPGPGQELWWSEDGRSWVLVDETPFGGVEDWVYTLAGYGGRWVAIGDFGTAISGEEPVWVSEDGLSWRWATDIPVASDPSGSGCPFRVAGGAVGWVIVDVCGEQDRPVWLSRDGTQWQAVPMEGLVGEDEWFAGTIKVGTDRISIDSDGWGEALGWVGTLLGKSPTETWTALPIEEVRLGGGAFFERASTESDIRRGLGLVSAADTVVDGRFLVQGQRWDEGPVWWESGAVDEGWGDQQPRWIELDLGGNVTIGGAIVQADANDEYLLSYLDPTTGEWDRLWLIPADSWFGGMATRSNPFDDTEPMVFPEPVTTDLLRFEAWSGDGMYSVSEIQLFATPLSDLGAEVWVGPASEGTVTVTPVEWEISFNDQGQGIHTLFMIVDARPLTAERVEEVSGRLIWDETVVDLCGISIRDVGDSFLRIGDIFGTSEGCGSNPAAMQDAFDQFGMPETACIAVGLDGVDHEYCAPLW